MVLMNACRNCDYKIDADNPCIYFQNYQNDGKVLELKNIHPEVINDPTLPTTKDHKVPNFFFCFLIHLSNNYFSVPIVWP